MHSMGICVQIEICSVQIEICSVQIEICSVLYKNCVFVFKKKKKKGLGLYGLCNIETTRDFSKLLITPTKSRQTTKQSRQNSGK